MDLVAQDISRPLQEQGGAIVEVNAGPGLLMHLKPAQGEAQPVGPAIVEHPVPWFRRRTHSHRRHRGSSGKTPVARLVAWLLHLDGRRVGLACSEGIFLGARQVERIDASRWEPSRRLLAQPHGRSRGHREWPGHLLGEGLAYDRCAVGVVTRIDPPVGLESFDVHTIEQVVQAVRTQVDVVLPSGYAVLNADDERVAALASLCDGEVIFHALDPDQPVVAHHLAKEGKAVVFVGDVITLRHGARQTAVVDVSRLSAGLPSRESMLAAVAAGWALGLSPDLMRAGFSAHDATASAADQVVASVTRLADATARSQSARRNPSPSH